MRGLAWSTAIGLAVVIALNFVPRAVLLAVAFFVAWFLVALVVGLLLAQVLRGRSAPVREDAQERASRAHIYGDSGWRGR